MRFGRMEKRFHANQFNQLATKVEEMTGKTIGTKEKAMLTRGADEIDLVRSGLEETMITAYHQIRDIQKRKKGVEDLRTAAFLNALNKISSDTYHSEFSLNFAFDKILKWRFGAPSRHFFIFNQIAK